MAEAERGLLRVKLVAPAGGRSAISAAHRAPAAPLQRVLELVGRIEMVLDYALVAAGDKDETLDPGLARLVDDISQDRDGRRRSASRGLLCRRQEARAEARDGKHGLAQRFSHHTRRCGGG